MIITEIAGTQRYHLASVGRRVAVLFTRTYSRVLAPGLSVLDLGYQKTLRRAAS